MGNIFWKLSPLLEIHLYAHRCLPSLPATPPPPVLCTRAFGCLRETHKELIPFLTGTSEHRHQQEFWPNRFWPWAVWMGLALWGDAQEGSAGPPPALAGHGKPVLRLTKKIYDWVCYSCRQTLFLIFRLKKIRKLSAKRASSEGLRRPCGRG